MLPSETSIELARKARETGLFSMADAGEGVAPACLGALLVSGKDAASFLHAQVTNEVESLQPGEGNHSARVKRTGHLLELFSLHRLPDTGAGKAFLLVLSRARVSSLQESLDQFLFADDVELRDVSGDFEWMVLQGPKAAEVLDQTMGPSSAGPWIELPPCTCLPANGGGLAEGSLILSRSFTGDRGFVIGAKIVEGKASHEGVFRDAARVGGLVLLTSENRQMVFHILRVEAGMIHVEVDTPKRERLLPETGLEHQTVSYSKGCYLGQEVIARVRTYGSLPFGLRGVVLTDGAGEGDLPELGADLALADGSVVGQFVSGTYSPTLNSRVVMAYIDRAHRTPGTELEMKGEAGVIHGKVTLLPFYQAPEGQERVTLLYDQAIRTFADGNEEKALSMLEESLRLDPTFSDGYEAVGVILGRAKRFHEAIDIFKRLEEVVPEEPMVNTNLSLYYMKIGDKATAEDEAGKAMQKSLAQGAGGGSEALAEQEQKMAEERRADAQRKSEMFAQVLEIDADDPVALFGLGSALSTLGKWEEAADVLAHACVAQKDNSAAFLARGKALEALERFGDAGEVYQQGMDVASRRGDLMPLKEMEHRVLLLGAMNPASSLEKGSSSQKD